MRNFHYPGRSPVMSVKAMAATSHPLATEAALSTLKKGGNALDAALTACAVQGVVEPASTGIGGDCFCLYAPKNCHEPIALNGSGYTPATMSLEAFLAKGLTKIDRQSPHSVTIPGAVDAWFRLNADHGRMAMVDILKPAIDFARFGYPVSPRVYFDFIAQTKLVQQDPETARVFMSGGNLATSHFPKIGDKHFQPDLAQTLEKIAHHGPQIFYQGELAEKMVSYLRSKGGFHHLDDFANYQAQYVTPISKKWGAYRVFECPPNGQGVIALMLLGMVEKLALSKMSLLDPARIHLEIEAGRLAYADRDNFIADPLHADVPVEALLSDQHLDNLIDHIDPKMAMADIPHISLPKHQSTVYIAVVDEAGNACSLINTLFEGFGSVQTVPDTGIVLHNRAQSFSLRAGHPNQLAGRKRPRHTIIPAILFENGKARMPFGVMGGQYQAFGQMQFLTTFLQDGYDIQQAMERPRFFPQPNIRQVDVEATFDTALCKQLEKMGHQLNVPHAPIGGAQAIWMAENGVLIAGSDPRKDGLALGY